MCLSDYVASLEVFCDGCWCQSVQGLRGQIYLNGYREAQTRFFFIPYKIIHLLETFRGTNATVD